MPKSTKSPGVSKIRKSTGKRLRFAVFHRDHFTCQYCGAQPPDVVLVIDHIVPVAEGGETTIDNLITGCEPCNQGKAHKMLTAGGIRPDADLRYLETQQEIAEIRRYQRFMEDRNQAIAEVMPLLQQEWCDLSGHYYPPDEKYFLPLLLEYGIDIVDEAVIVVAPRVRTGYIGGNKSDWLPYLSAVCRNKGKEREEEID